jgi:hypothetical protein
METANRIIDMDFNYGGNRLATNLPHLPEHAGGRGALTALRESTQIQNNLVEAMRSATGTHLLEENGFYVRR